MAHRRYLIAIVVVFVLIVVAGALYEWIVPGLSSARTVPPKLETAIATWLLHQSVPAEAQKQVNPLGLDAADIVAGRDLTAEVEAVIIKSVREHVRSEPAIDDRILIETH